MRSSRLLELAKGFRWLKDRKIQIDDAEVFLAANFAQNFILKDLHPFEAIGYLATENGQEFYEFSRGVISAASNTTPIVIDQAGHPHHTGDQVTVYGVGGNTAANGTRLVTRISASQYSLDGSVGNSAYTSGGYSYHCLMAAGLLPYDELRETTNNGRIKRRQFDHIEQIRSNLAAGNVQYFYVLQNPAQGMGIGFYGIPSSNLKYAFRYERIPLPHEEISSTVDPWAIDDLLLYYRTMYHIIDLFKQTEGDAALQEQKGFIQKYLNQRQTVVTDLVRRKLVVDAENFDNVRWR